MALFIGALLDFEQHLELLAFSTPDFDGFGFANSQTSMRCDVFRFSRNFMDLFWTHHSRPKKRSFPSSTPQTGQTEERQAGIQSPIHHQCHHRNLKLKHIPGTIQRPSHRLVITHYLLHTYKVLFRVANSRTTAVISSPSTSTHLCLPSKCVNQPNANALSDHRHFSISSVILLSAICHGIVCLNFKFVHTESENCKCHQ